MNMFDVCFTEQFIVKASGNNLEKFIAFLYQILATYFYFNPKQSYLLLLTFDSIVKVPQNISRQSQYLFQKSGFLQFAFLQAKLVHVWRPLCNIHIQWNLLQAR